ncbi:MAG: hypothetical protein OQL09_09950, partial [Gammaproteobacteria bacterium]|nr:hypothetical protein [Gammaproteobacteria bacterium]
MLKKYLLTVFTGLALLATSVQAELITINVSATVNHVDDMGNVLGGQLTPGDIITGSYTYDTATIDRDTSPEFGNYPHASGVGNMSFTVNGINFSSDQSAPDDSYAIAIENYSNIDIYRVMSFMNQTLPSGARIDFLGIDLADFTGTAINSDALPTTAPDLSGYEIIDLHGDGRSADGLNWFNFSAKITSLTVDGSAPSGSYQLNAIVRHIYDPGNALQGKINIGDAVSGSYAVDLASIDTDPNLNHAYYMIPADSKYGFDLNINA